MTPEDDSTTAELPVTPRVIARTLGERLRHAREAKGLTLADISGRTRVPARQLAALEADAHETLPGFIFAIGFAKSFAREVGLDPDEIAAQFRAETTRAAYAPPSASPFETLEPERVPSRGLAWASAAAVLAVIGGLFWYFEMRDPAPTEAVSIETAAPDVVADSGATTDLAAAEAAATPAPAATVPATTAPAATDPAAAPAAGPNIPIGGTAVTLTAKQDVWIQISDRASGAKAMSRILKQGETYTVPTGDYTLWTGRAGALDVRVGGRPVPALGGEAETVRDVSLSAGSLLGRVAASAPMPSVRPIATMPGQQP